jgi:hypothetical protein
MFSGIQKKVSRLAIGALLSLLLLVATSPAYATTTCRWLDHNTVLFCESSGSSAGTFVAFFDTAVGYWVYI